MSDSSTCTSTKSPSTQIIQLTHGSITTEETDAIVNAANSSLLGGGGVDGAIHRAGGSAILHQCRLLSGCKVGEAKSTTAGKLKARHLIHTVGPKWNGGTNNETDKLAACYRNSLLLAHSLGAASIAFPAISTGIYHFPKEAAAKIALKTIVETLPETEIELVRIILFYDPESQEFYEQAAKDLGVELTLT